MGKLLFFTRFALLCFCGLWSPSVIVTAAGYQMVIPNSRLPVQCLLVSAVYDGDDSVFLFCNGGSQSHLLVYSLSTGAAQIAGGLPVQARYSRAVLAGSGRLFYIAEDPENPGNSAIWESHMCNLYNWVPVAVLRLYPAAATVVFDQMDHIYIYGGAESGELTQILKFSISTYDITGDGSLEAFNRYAASLWVPSQNIFYSFGGGFPDFYNRSYDILKYEPQTGGRVFEYDVFPEHITDGCAFWVEESASAFIVCGNASDPRLNMLRFNSLEEAVVIEQVVGFGFKCQRVGCVYSEHLRRAYLFGGLTYDGSRVMYIEMGGDDNSNYKTQSIQTQEETCPTPSPSSDTTVTSGSTIAATTESTTPGLRVRMSNIMIPSWARCGYPFRTTAAYNGDDSVLISCLHEFFIYNISTDRITASGETSHGTDSARHVWVGRDTIYRFEGGSREGNLTLVWKISASSPSEENWQLVASISDHYFYHGSAVWDGNDSIFLFASDYYVRDPTVKMFSITDHSVKNAGELPLPLRESGVVWDRVGDGAFIFGGVALGSTSKNISRYDPQSEIITKVGELPALMPNPCAVWTGQEALVLCSSYRFVRFDPLTNVAQPEFVQDWPSSSCYDPGCIYTPHLNRVYIFGGLRQAGLHPAPIMYIDLDEDSTPSSTTAEPTTHERTVSVTTDRSTTTAVQPTTEAQEDLPRCTAFDKYDVLYVALVGHHATNPCPGISNGTASWYCEAAGRFVGDSPDYRNCTSLWLDPGKETIGDDAPISFAKARSILIDIQRHLRDSADPSKNVTYFGHEIQIVIRIGLGLVELLQNSTRIGQVEHLSLLTFGIFDQLLAYPGPWEELSQRERPKTGTAFISASDALALELGDRYKRQGVTAGYRKEFNAGHSFQAQAGVEPSDGNGGRLTFPQQYSTKGGSYIEISADWVNYFPDDKLVSFCGLELNQGIGNYIFLNDGRESDSSTGHQSKIVNGPLMSFTFGSSSSSNLRGPSQRGVNFTDYGVRITFQHEVSAWGPERAQVRRRLHADEEPKAVLGTGVCVFWDNDISDWSSTGCRLVSSTVEQTVCECNHLSAFAVIMNLHDYIGKDLPLRIMSWVLSSLSILCLVLSIGVLLYSRFGRPLLPKHPRNDLTLYLCIALLLANVLILTTMDKDTLHLSDTMCTASAVALHYLLLLVFAWMALEGILLAKLVFLDVFASGREYAKWENAGALLIPVGIVAVTCGLNFGQDGHAYGDEAFCWLHGTYLWSFIAIAAAVITFNASVLAMSIRKSYLIHKSHGRTKAATFWLRGALGLSLILGLTWTSGFIMLIGSPPLANIAAYVFTATNASQGIFIFIFHMSSKKVRAHFRSLTLSTSSGSGGGGSRGPASNSRKWKRKGTIPTNSSY